MWLFLMVSRVGLQCVIVVFPDHTHIHFKKARTRAKFYVILTSLNYVHSLHCTLLLTTSIIDRAPECIIHVSKAKKAVH